MKHETNFVPALAVDSVSHEAPVIVKASGLDIARQLLAMREAARVAGLAKVAVCLDYAYYEALGADLHFSEATNEAD